jgi:hypothetical protein
MRLLTVSVLAVLAAGLPPCFAEQPNVLFILTDDPEHKDLVTTLRKELDRLIAESGAVPDKMPMDEGIKGELPDEKIR